MSILINLLLGLFVVISILLVLIILMQRPKSEGLGAAFGAAVTENIFGAQTTNVLTKITAWLAGIFFVLTFALAVLYAHKSTTQSALRRELAKTPPAATAPAAVSPSPVTGQISPSPATTTASPETTSAPASTASPTISPSPTAKP